MVILFKDMQPISIGMHLSIDFQMNFDFVTDESMSMVQKKWNDSLP